MATDKEGDKSADCHPKPKSNQHYRDCGQHNSEGME
jgi:hypothetical protein